MKAVKNRMPCLLSDAVVAGISDGEVVVAKADSQKALVLNETAAIVAFLCTGEHSVREIAQLFCETLGLDIERTERDVQALLAELQARGLLDDNDSLAV